MRNSRGGSRVGSSGRGAVVIAIISISILCTTILIILCIRLSLHNNIVSVVDDAPYTISEERQPIEAISKPIRIISQNHRRLQLSMSDAISKLEHTATNNNKIIMQQPQQMQQITQQLQPQPQQQQQQTLHQIQHGKTVFRPGGVLINLMRRAKDVVSESDVPFLLQIPHTSTETIYNIMTQCYGLVGKEYTTSQEIERARAMNVVDNYYVSSHDRPKEMFANFGERFHFLATPHYQEGTSLLTLKHKGRIIVMLRHPCEIAEAMYLNLRQINPSAAQLGSHVKGLVQHVNSTNYYDNWMTRMLANVPPNAAVTEDHFREARMVLENKFLIGMTSDMAETVRKRLGLYFGWKELPEKQGCEIEMIKNSMASIVSPSMLEEGSHEWRFVRLQNHFDMKLYARGMAIFGDQKMRVPIHSFIRERQVTRVVRAFDHLRNVVDPKDDSDIPFFW